MLRLLRWNPKAKLKSWCLILKKLLVTIDDIKIHFKKNTVIKKIYECLKWNKTKSKPRNNNIAFSICDGVHLYAENVVVILFSLQKMILKFHVGHP